MRIATIGGGIVGVASGCGRAGAGRAIRFGRRARRAETMAAPSAPSVMSGAGDDAARRPAAPSPVEDPGFAAVEAGPLPDARLPEALAMPWIDPAPKRGPARGFSFVPARR